MYVSIGVCVCVCVCVSVCVCERRDPISYPPCSDPLPSALLFAFRGHVLYRKEKEDINKVLHILHNASTALSSSVALPTDECSQTADTLWQVCVCEGVQYTCML